MTDWPAVTSKLSFFFSFPFLSFPFCFFIPFLFIFFFFSFPLIFFLVLLFSFPFLSFSFVFFFPFSFPFLSLSFLLLVFSCFVFLSFYFSFPLLFLFIFFPFLFFLDFFSFLFPLTAPLSFAVTCFNLPPAYTPRRGRIGLHDLLKWNKAGAAGRSHVVVGETAYGYGYLPQELFEVAFNMESLSKPIRHAAQHLSSKS